MCAARQSEILESAAAMLKAGGRVVYSTCTFSPEENEGVISAFLHEHPDFSVLPCDAPYFDRGRPDWIDDPAEGIENTLRLFPHRLRGEGHFAAVLVRSGDRQNDVPTERAGRLPAEISAFFAESLTGNSKLKRNSSKPFVRFFSIPAVLLKFCTTPAAMRRLLPQRRFCLL